VRGAAAVGGGVRAGGRSLAGSATMLRDPAAALGAQRAMTRTSTSVDYT